jgi:acid phosphatase type 7
MPYPRNPRGRRLPPRRHAGQQVSKRHAFRSNQTFEPLPPPRGAYPYHFDLEDFLSPEELQRIEDDKQLVFHVAGDTGGVKNPVPQQIVALRMDDDFHNAATTPSFFYHLGDVVYYYGERSQYYPQFYEPYADYSAPIVAIPGNHDGDIDPSDPMPPPSLQAFADNFCAATPHLNPEAEEVHRDTMTQPNVYWTLVTPYLTIVGLYTNVPEGGRVDDDQAAWLNDQLSTAPDDRFLLVALHHPIYSADAHHGGSETMGRLLDSAFETTKRIPDAVLTGHVHNYQRFTRQLDGRGVPYIVAGAGGYWHLHYMAKDENGNDLPTPWQPPDLPGVTLEAYVDDRHGFLRLTVDERTLSGEYITVPRPHESWRRGPAPVADRFEIQRGQPAP